MKSFILTSLFIYLHFLSIGQDENTYSFAPNYQDHYYLNQKGNTYKLDSFYLYKGFSDVWNLYDRGKAIKFNSKGKALEIIYHFWDNDSNTWLNKDYSTIDYYNDEQIKVSLRRPWNSETQKWQDTSYFVKNNKNGNPIEQINKKWDYEQNKFIYGSNTLTTYTKGLKVSKLRLALDTTDYKWEKTVLSTYTYNENNLNDTLIIKVWDYTKWIDAYRTIYKYNDSGQLINSVEQKYEDKNWENYEKRKYAYDDFGNQIKIIIDRWTNTEWVKKDKITSTFDQNNAITTKAIFSFIDNQWHKKSKYIFRYDNNGNQIESYYYMWDSDKNNWKNSYMSRSEFDSNNNEILYERKRWNTNLSEWDKILKLVNFWSEFTPNSSTFLSDTNLNIYPNPTTNRIILDCQKDADILLYNKSGVLLQHFTNVNEIDLSIFPKGMYFLEVKSQGIISLKKIIKL